MERKLSSQSKDSKGEKSMARRNNERSMVKRGSDTRSKSLCSLSSQQDRAGGKSEMVRRQKTNNNNNMKKFLMKLKQKCHISKKSEHPKEVLDAFARAKTYRNTLFDVVQAARAVTQQDPMSRRGDNLEAIENGDEYEVIYATLEPNRTAKKPFEPYEHIEFFSPATYFLGKEHREYHRAVGNLMKPLVKFLEADYNDMEQRLAYLENLRDEKDLKQQEFEANGVGGDAAQHATAEYNKACEELMQVAKQMLEQTTIDGHVEILKEWHKMLKEHHCKMNGILEKALGKAAAAEKAAAAPEKSTPAASNPSAPSK